MERKEKKESNSIDLAYIADVSVSTNPSYYANFVFKSSIKRKEIKDIKMVKFRFFQHFHHQYHSKLSPRFSNI